MINKERPQALILKDEDGSIYKAIHEALSIGQKVYLLKYQEDYVDNILKNARRILSEE